MIWCVSVSMGVKGLNRAGITLLQVAETLR